MRDINQIPQTKWKVGEFRFVIRSERSILEIKSQPHFIWNIPQEHEDVAKIFLDWLRKLPKEQQMKIFSVLVLEYQLGVIQCPPDIEGSMKTIQGELDDADRYLPEDDPELEIDEYPEMEVE